jgi:hypothetical protein
MVIVDVPEPGAVMGLELKLTVTPVGWPVALNETAELKLPRTVVVIVELPLSPCSTETVLAEADSVKLGAADTLSTTFAVCVIPPPVAVIVIG